MTTNPEQDAQAFINELLRDIAQQFAARLREYRPNLAQSTGVLPGQQLPSGGPAGVGYPPAPTTHTTITDWQEAVEDVIGAAVEAGTNITVSYNDATGKTTITATTSGGTVTSVALSAPAELSVSGSPVTTSGTLALAWATEAANRILAGPASGGAATPTFRALVAADIPDLSATYQPLDSDLTAIAALTTTSFGRALLTLVDAAAARSAIGAGTGNGSVTSVGITAPAAGLTSTGGPITTSGAITLALANDLAALEGLASTGFAVRAATDTWAQRTITGTANRVAVTNGDGVAGNPTLDISTAYVGQATITTLGTIATGIWQGTKAGLAYGGTNADLSAAGGTGFVLKQTTAGAAITSAALVAADIPALDTSKLTTGQLALARGGSGADLSATGGTSQVVKQTTVGGTLSVARLTSSDIQAVGARVYRTTTQAIAHATAVVLLFDAERYDNGNLHSTVTNTGRLTAPVAGIYEISLTAGFDTFTTVGIRQLQIEINGTTTINAVNVVPKNYTFFAVSGLYHMAAGDYAQAIAYQDTGGSLNILSQGNYSPEFAMQLIAAD